MEPDVIKAIPREAVIRWVVFGIIAGTLLILLTHKFLFPFISNYLSIKDKAEALFRSRLVMAGFGLSLAPCIVYPLFLARRVFQSRQFPPPGTIVWKATPIVRGRAALLRAWLMVFLTFVMLGLAIYAQFLPQLIVSKAAEPPKFIVARTHPSR